MELIYVILFSSLFLVQQTKTDEISQSANEGSNNKPTHVQDDGSNKLRSFPRPEASQITHAIIEGALAEQGYNEDGLLKSISSDYHNNQDALDDRVESTTKGIFRPFRPFRPLKPDKNKRPENPSVPAKPILDQTAVNKTANINHVQGSITGTTHTESHLGGSTSSLNQAQLSTLNSILSGSSANVHTDSSEELEHKPHHSSSGFFLGLLNGINTNKNPVTSTSNNGISALLTSALSSAISQYLSGSTTNTINLGPNSQSTTLLQNILSLAGNKLLQLIEKHIEHKHQQHPQVVENNVQEKPGNTGISYSNNEDIGNNQINAHSPWNVGQNGNRPPNPSNTAEILSYLLALQANGNIGGGFTSGSISGNRPANPQQNFNNINGLLPGGFSQGLNPGVNGLTPQNQINGLTAIGNPPGANGLSSQNGIIEHQSIGNLPGANGLNPQNPISGLSGIGSFDGNINVNPSLLAANNIINGNKIPRPSLLQNVNLGSSNDLSGLYGVLSKLPTTGSKPIIKPGNINNPGTTISSFQAGQNQDQSQPQRPAQLNFPTTSSVGSLNTGLNKNPSTVNSVFESNTGGSFNLAFKPQDFFSNKVDSLENLDTQRLASNFITKEHYNSINKVILINKGIHKSPFYAGLISMKPLSFLNALSVSNAIVSAAGGSRAGFVSVIIGIGGNGVPIVISNVDLNPQVTKKPSSQDFSNSNFGTGLNFGLSNKNSNQNVNGDFQNTQNQNTDGAFQNMQNQNTNGGFHYLQNQNTNGDFQNIQSALGTIYGQLNGNLQSNGGNSYSYGSAHASSNAFVGGELSGSENSATGTSGPSYVSHKALQKLISQSGLSSDFGPSSHFSMEQKPNRNTKELSEQHELDIKKATLSGRALAGALNDLFDKH